MSCEIFPLIPHSEKNPAFLLFGNRLYTDQSPTEFLIELLLVTSSPKQVGTKGMSFASPLPEFELLRAWPETDSLRYAPRARLNLKLFAFMGASRLDSRHETHREHYKDLLERLQRSIRVTEAGGENDVLRTLENLFLGFQGAGSGRTWCAQSFLPVCRGLLARETIWSESIARRNDPRQWCDLMEEHKWPKYFASSKRLFLARGGELLFLQLCNALRQSPATIQAWAEQSGVCLESQEMAPAWLHAELQRELGRVLDQCPQTLTEIADFLDNGIEADTALATDTDGGKPRYVDAGWCAAESWKEGYVFAVELLRLCTADLDVVERLQLLEAACAMQVLRSLAAQSARHCETELEVSWPGYRLAVSAPVEDSSAVKRISRHTAKVAERLIYHALRSGHVPLPNDAVQREKVLKEADRRYGGKLFSGLARRVGFLIPRRGAGVRFTLNEQLLRLLVVTTVPVGGRLTYDRFKALVEARHGLVFDSDGFARADAWTGGTGRVSLGNNIDAWLQEMLAAAGLLIHLSDSCALVENPAAKKGVNS
jgi:hypothetical protein